MSSVRIGNEEVSVEIAAMGAEMQSITTADGAQWLWNGDPEFWTGRAPILFPIVGKAPGDQVTVEGEGGSMRQHGFARRSVFTLLEEGKDFCRFGLEDGPTSKMSYPFSFSLVVEYRVVGRGLTVSAEVTNRDTRVMPFGFGFHPALHWPLPGAEGHEHRVVLDSGAEPPMVRLEDGLLDPEPLPSPFSGGAVVLKHGLFEDDAMIFPEGAGAGARFEAGPKAVHLSWENLPNFALWSKPGAPFLCLEPWHGMAATVDGSTEIGERPDIVKLGPEASARFSLSLRFEG